MGKSFHDSCRVECKDKPPKGPFPDYQLPQKEKYRWQNKKELPACVAE
jgi:hypothetical protein